MAFLLNEFLPYRLSVAATQVSRQFAARYAAEAGLTVPEWRVLAHLAQSGTVSVRDITLKVNLDKSIVSRAATRLEHLGLVGKSEHDKDRRLVALQLTEAGQTLMEQLSGIAEKFQQELRALLGPDANAFEDGLERLLTRFES